MKKLFVIGIAALLLVAFTMPAMAKVKIGGIIFTDFYYIDRNSANASVKGMGNDSFTNTAIQLPDITRLYARWTNEDNVGMYIEFGLGQDGGNTLVGKNYGPTAATASHINQDSDVVLRHAYGWWDINPSFQILAGKTTTPFSPLNPSQLLGLRSGSVNIIGVGYGDFYSGRFTQVRGTFKFGKVARLAIALVDPNGTAVAGSYGPWDGKEGTDYQTNTKLPRIDIGVPIYLGPVSIYPGLMYQHRTVDRLGALNSGVDNTLDTWIGSLGAKAGFGPFGVALEGNYGQNWGNSRALFGASPSVTSAAGPGIASATLKTNDQIKDAETYSFWIDLSYKFGPITPHFMYGQQKSKNENKAGAKMEAKTQMYGFSIPIDLAKGFRLRPEFMWYDDGDVTTAGSPSADMGSYAIYGVQFQITF